MITEISEFSRNYSVWGYIGYISGLYRDYPGNGSRGKSWRPSTSETTAQSSHVLGFGFRVKDPKP